MIEHPKKVIRKARIVSNLLHPWIIFTPVIAIVAYEATSGLDEWARWTLLTLSLAYFLPSLYVRLRSIEAFRAGVPRDVRRSYFREHTGEMVVLACLFGIPGSLALSYLGGPDTVLAVLLATSGAMLIVAMFNIVYRVSFHMTVVTSMLFSLWILFGGIALITLPLVPLLGLARYRLREHTPGQLASGLVLGLVVTLVAFWGLGVAFRGGYG